MMGKDGKRGERALSKRNNEKRSRPLFIEIKRESSETGKEEKMEFLTDFFFSSIENFPQLHV